jgi:hypothetical protein
MGIEVSHYHCVEVYILIPLVGMMKLDVLTLGA